MRDHVYLDSSALVKLVVLEPESAALRAFLNGHPVRLSSGLVAVEVPRGYGAAEQRRAVELLARIALVDVDRAILRAPAAAALLPRRRAPEHFRS